MRQTIKKISDELEKKGIDIVKDADMSMYCSFRAGGCADLLVLPENVDELKYILDIAKNYGEEILVIGNGSNILVKDGGFRGVIVRLEKLNKIETNGNTLVCGCGALLSTVAKAALNESLTGFEFASGIPGSIGGGIFMNAGAYDGEMKNVCVSSDILDINTGEIRTVSVDELDLSYRHSILQETGDIAVSVAIELEKGDKEEIAAKMRELAEKRNTKQPVSYPSAGSFFKRPTGYFAGKLVQDAGCKGLSVGGAKISELHSGFMINTGGATAKDIITLMKLVQNTVYDKFGVKMEPEVRIVGED